MLCLLTIHALQINVFDDLTDSDMRRSISIVNYSHQLYVRFC